jgi:hypothetical protein
VFSAFAFWLSAIGCLAAGVAGGWLLRIMLDPSEQKLRDAETRIRASEAALDDYRRQVTEHFRGTADRVNKLTDDYRELHSHLAQGAMGLCNPSATEAPLLTSLSGGGVRAISGSSVNPPLDYAPPMPEDGGPDDLGRLREV